MIKKYNAFITAVYKIEARLQKITENVISLTKQLQNKNIEKEKLI